MSRARGLVTALLAILVVVVLVVAGAFSVSWVLTETRRDSQTIEAIGAIDVRLAAGHVELVGSARPNVTVELTRIGSPLHRATAAVRRDGEQLLIVSSCDSLFGPIAVGTCRTDVRVFLPDTLPAVVHTEHGTLASTGMHSGTRLTTDSGPVRVAGHAGDLQVSTLRGSIEVRDLAGGSGDVRARGGSIDVSVSTAGALLSLRTDGGDITATLPPGSYAVDAQTDGGELRLAEGLSNDPASPYQIRVRTAGGDFTATVPG
jgi:Putative adhesin